MSYQAGARVLLDPKQHTVQFLAGFVFGHGGETDATRFAQLVEQVKTGDHARNYDLLLSTRI